jgi:hypothetical protein
MIFLRLKVFIQSLLFHIYNGFPKASQKEIDQRYSICYMCNHFDKQNNQCKICGCFISTKKQFLNKLAWADQSCPDNRWYQINRK